MVGIVFSTSLAIDGLSITLIALDVAITKHDLPLRKASDIGFMRDQHNLQSIVIHL